MRIIFATLLFFVSFVAFGQDFSDPKKQEDKSFTTLWKPVKYAGDNTVLVCKNDEKTKCHRISMPQEMGEVENIVFGEGNTPLNTWLAFTNSKIFLCLEKGIMARCAFVVQRRQGNVKISFDTTDEYPVLIYNSVANNGIEVKQKVEIFYDKLNQALAKLKSQKLKDERLIDGQITIQLEDAPSDWPIVYITAPFPEISVFDGASQLISFAVYESGPDLPNPLPPGVAPGDIEKARDPVGMATCTAYAYRTYITMVGGCSRHLPYLSRYASCMKGSMDAYVDILMNECYANHY